MVTGRRNRRWRGLAVGVAVLVGASTVAACEPADDAQPPVASVNFEPRLVVSVGTAGLDAEAGGRDGARLDGPDQATVPKGSVVELRNAAGEERRVVITRSLLENADPGDGVWLDTGAMSPDETTVLGLTAVGTYRFTATGTHGAGPDGGSSELTVHVVA